MDQIRSLPLHIKCIFFGLIVVAAYILFYRLGAAPLDNWDEAWYTDIAKNMIRSGDYLIPHWNKAVLIDKAPFYMWTTAFWSMFFGLNEFSARLTSALSGLVIIVVTIWYSYKKYGLVPALVAYSSLVLNNLFIYRARSGNLDALTALLILISYFVMISKHQKRLYILAVLFAITYLTRTSFVAFPLLIFIVHEILFRRNEIKKFLVHYIIAGSLFIILTGWWLLIGYLKEGMPFITYYVLYSDQKTSHASLSNFKTDYFWYAYYALQRRLFYIFAAGVALLIFKLKQAEYCVLFYFATTLLVLLTFSARTDNWYLTPSIPFWSLVIAYACYRVLNLLRPIKVAPLLLLLLVGYISYRTYTQNIIPILYTSSAFGEAQSGKYLKEHTDENETIVRLDHLYPTLVYYSDRKVLSSPVESDTKNYFISRVDLIKKIADKKIRYAAGSKQAVEEFERMNPDVKLEKIPMNSDEFVLKFL